MTLTTEELRNSTLSKLLGNESDEGEEVVADEDSDLVSNWEIEEDEEEEEGEEIEEEDEDGEEVSDDTQEIEDSSDKSSEGSSDSDNWLEFRADGRQEKVDLSDTENLKRLLSKAYGADKAMRDRAAATKKVASLESKLKELEEGPAKNWKFLLGKFEEGGELGILDALAQKEGAGKAWLEEQIRAYNEDSPEEIERREAIAALQRMKKKEQRQEAEAEARKEREAADKVREATESFHRTASDIYHKLKFQGEDVVTSALNEKLWREAKKRLDSAHGDDIIHLRRNEIEEQFKAVSDKLREAHKEADADTRKKLVRKTKARSQRKAAAIAKEGRTREPKEKKPANVGDLWSQSLAKMRRLGK